MQNEREGGHIDGALVSNVLSIFVEISESFWMECYKDDFEYHLLKNTEDYYFLKAQNWVYGDSCTNYLIEVTYLFAYIWLHSWGVDFSLNPMHDQYKSVFSLTYTWCPSENVRMTEKSLLSKRNLYHLSFEYKP